ncbi:MAG TPA: Ppx/GppA phosphatase family protein [Aggregatilineales bacterium]|nr:Ppx/GppA phosphatase family protein [Aggregatilineales bacterium]
MNRTGPLPQLESLAAHSDVYKDSQRMAILDLGSNSFRMIVVEYVPGLSFKVVDEIAESVRLSEGMGESNILRAAAMDRAVQAVQIFAAFCRASRIKDIVAVGTSAIRDARNQSALLTRLKATTGIDVRVLSGEEEAHYGYLGAINSSTLVDGFVLDMGGGSLQITRVEDRRAREAISFPLGAVRVTERFLTSDPVRHAELEALRDYLSRQFGTVRWFHYKPDTELVFVGGGVRMLGRLAQKMEGYPLDMMQGYVLSSNALKAIRKTIAEKSIADRRRIPGMKPERADISLGSAVVVYEALRASGFEQLTISAQGVRGGLFYEHFLQGDSEPLFEDVRKASVLNLAHIYRFQEQHALHIAHLTLSMLDQLPEGSHLCRSVEREILWAASMLHDIGVAIDYNDHHKHGAYLILNDGLPGFTHREIALIALLTRYHRKGEPVLGEFERVMEPGDARRLLQLCALLRLAEQLDRSRDGVVRDVRLTVDVGNQWAQMELLARGDGQVALWSVLRHRDIFQQAFGLQLEVTLTPGG